MTPSSERICRECGDILRGRSDQKFCNDQCRNTYNNRLLRDASGVIRQVNRTLRKNQAILSGLNHAGKTTVMQSELSHQGFNFNYFTNIYTTRNGRTYFFCYDKGYALVESGKALLVDKQGYVD